MGRPGHGPCLLVAMAHGHHCSPDICMLCKRILALIERLSWPQLDINLVLTEKWSLGVEQYWNPCNQRLKLQKDLELWKMDFCTDLEELPVLTNCRSHYGLYMLM